jgi:hypothetical protein
MGALGFAPNTLRLGRSPNAIEMNNWRELTQSMAVCAGWIRKTVQDTSSLDTAIQEHRQKGFDT